ncbi:hypothetical protein [Actinomadura nitritigenes]|uniref:hypothetical protein n=1 Tax=Actinomadura nitritigenes TaxID=134602 RepID=UPI003D8C4B00
MPTPDRPSRPSPDPAGLFAKPSPPRPPGLFAKPPPPEPEPPAGPAWLVVPARVIALIVVVPFRLLYDLLTVVGRGVAACWRFLIRVPAAIAVALYRWVLRPLGLVLWWPLRMLGIGIAAAARRLYRYVLTPIGRVLDLVLLRPLRALGRGLAWLGGWIGRGFAWLFRGIGWLVAVLIVLPVSLLWRYLLLPPLLGLAWVAHWIGRGLAAAWRAFATAVVWTWRQTGRCLGWLLRVFVVVPARALWRYVLAPIGAGIAGTWRLSARVLSWLWRTLVVAPFRVLVLIPLRWFGTTVLVPVGRGIGAAWRVTVRDPLRAVRRSLREAGQDVRRTLRRTFLGR